MSDAHRPLKVTRFADVQAKAKQEYAMSWPELFARLTDPDAYERKADAPLLKLGTFGTTRTAHGALRSDENMLVISGVEGDYDAERVTPMEAVDMLERHRIRACVYTSPSHTDDKPRWRVLAPLSKDHPPEARAALVRRLNGALGGILTGESFTASQTFYYGRVNGHPYQCLATFGDPEDGICIDELESLDEIAIGPPRPSSTQTDEIANDDDLRHAILSGENYHEALRSLSARFAGRGMAAADIVATLEGLMDQSKAPRDARWKARRKELPRMVEGAIRKFQRDSKKKAKPAASRGPDDEFADVMTAVQIMALPDSAIAACVPERIPAGLVVVGGRPKAKKSWYLLQLGIAKARGSEFMGKPARQGRVLLLQLEDNPRRGKKRFAFFGINDQSQAPANLHIMYEWPSGTDGIAKIDRWMERYPDTVLIGVDVLQRMRGQRERNASVYEADYQYMGLLHALTTKYPGLTVVVIHHIKKGDVSDPVEAINGSFAIAGAADAYIILRRADEQRWVAHVDGRDWESWDHEFMWEFRQGEGWVQLGIYSDDLTGRQAELVQMARDHGHIGPTDVARRYHISKVSALEALRSLVAKGVMYAQHGKYKPATTTVP